MHGKPVAETLHVRRYQVGDESNVATFDRSYRSTMLASPSHLVFLTALVHMQKMLYMALCERWGLHYEVDGPELLKIWPTSIEVKIPELGVEERDLEQELSLKELRDVRGGRFRLVAAVDVLAVCRRVRPGALAQHVHSGTRAFDGLRLVRDSPAGARQGDLRLGAGLARRVLQPVLRHAVLVSGAPLLAAMRLATAACYWRSAPRR